MTLFDRTRGIREHQLDLAVIGCIWLGITVIDQIALEVGEDRDNVHAALGRLVAKGAVQGKEETSQHGTWVRWMLTE